MKFELEQLSRDMPDDVLLADLKRVSLLSGGAVTARLYSKHGQFGSSAIISRFGKWNAALIRAGIDATQLRDVSNDEMLEDLRTVAEAADGVLSPRVYNQQGKFGLTTILRRFGKWRVALRKAGIIDSIEKAKVHKTESALLNNIETVWLHLGRQPRLREMNDAPSKFKEGAYSSHFGSWRTALEKFVEVANGQGNEDEPTEEQEIPEPIEVSKKREISKPESAPKRTSRTPNLRLRWQVYKKDNFRCVSCGRSPAKDSQIELHIDHIVPYSRGGETVLDNLQLLCSDCNLGKSNME